MQKELLKKLYSQSKCENVFLLIRKGNFKAVILALNSLKGSSYYNDVLGATQRLVSTFPLHWGTMKSITFPQEGSFQ